MKNDSNSIEDIKAIRKIMEESSRFLSLSGLSGIFPGLTAIAGALVAYFFILDRGSMVDHQNVTWLLLADAIIVLIVSVIFAFYFSIKKARKEGKTLMTPTSKRMFINLLIPLVTGGAFVILLIIQKNFQLIIPCFLIFYGLALVNGGKFTFGEIYYLGICEIITGLLSAFIPDLGLIFWIFGFGILHIIYGLALYRKYEA
jgi:hypothetical protein